MGKGAQSALFFMQNTTLEGRNFEYHATGKAIIDGFTSLPWSFLMVVFHCSKTYPPLALLGAFLGLSIIIPWVVWRSLAFSMRMSSF